MGREIRCQTNPENSEAFIEDAKDFLVDKGYKLQVEKLPDFFIAESGGAIWTVLGTYRWKKTKRTVVVSRDSEDKDKSVEFIYNVSWLSMDYRPQKHVKKELDELLNDIEREDLEIDCKYQNPI